MNDNSRITVVTRIIGIILALVLGISAIWFASSALQELQTTHTPAVAVFSPGNCADQFFYGFESTHMGWEAQTAADSQAILNIKQTSEMAKSGLGALELQVDLDGNNPNKQSGEAFINLASNPPIGLKAPFDLEGIPITVWFFVPATAAGNPNAPNGVQIFVKDQNGLSEYSTWGNLTNNTDRWAALTFVPTRDPSESIQMQDGFEPSMINIIGVKIGVAKDSSASYSGSFWIDDICWQKP